jgi:hypothetical protein
MNRYQSVVFMQGDDADEPLDLLYNRDDDSSIVYHGPTAESVDAAFAFLKAWDYGDPTEEYDDPSSGSGDGVWVSDCGRYRMSAHLGLGYIGLERIVPLPVESYRCPCCGDDVIDTRPVCEACRKGDCHETLDACGDPGYFRCRAEFLKSVVGLGRDDVTDFSAESYVTTPTDLR